MNLSDIEKNIIVLNGADPIQAVSRGHDDLGRNRVFYLKDKNLYLKIYNSESLYKTETGALKILSNCSFVPELINHGTYEDKFYALSTSLKGIAYGEEIDDMHLIYESGKIHARLHESHRFEKAGYIQIDGSIKNIDDWYSHRVDYSDNLFKRITSKDYPENRIFEKGFKFAKSLEYVIKDNKDFSLCHYDYCFRNIITDNNCISGVIDFELARVTDPVEDLYKPVLKLNTPKKRKTFFEGYKSIRELDNNYREKVKYYTALLCLEICCWSRDRAKGFYDETINSLKEILNGSFDF